LGAIYNDWPEEEKKKRDNHWGKAETASNGSSDGIDASNPEPLEVATE